MLLVGHSAMWRTNQNCGVDMTCPVEWEKREEGIKSALWRRTLIRELPELSSLSSTFLSLTMETLVGAELCFPQLLNSSCRKPEQHRAETIFLYILLSSISLLTVALNLLVIISISHFRQKDQISITWNILPDIKHIQQFYKRWLCENRDYIYCSIKTFYENFTFWVLNSFLWCI